MKTIAFAGSNSSKSINQKLINYVVELTDSTEIIHLTDYDIPMYSMDQEEQNGIPESVKQLNDKLATADRLIISVCEHNGNMSAFFKNTMDWLSRHDSKFLKDTQITLFSTSPGKGGGASALAAAEKMLPYFGAEIKSTLNVPSFYQNYSDAGFNTDTQTHIKNSII
jgi:NAD(P)H-dependent FMN reductase